MKRIGTILFAMAILPLAFGQEAVSREKEKQVVTTPDSNVIAVTDSTVNKPEISDQTEVVIGDNMLSVRDDREGLRIRLGDRGITILESLENGSRVKFEKYADEPEEEITWNNQDENDRERERSRNRRRFRGHWSGFEFGFANYMTTGYELTIPTDIYYMDLHSGKSNVFNLNIMQQSLGITRHFGIVTGLGFNWTDYRFNGNNNITKGTNGVIEELSPTGLLKKSKLRTTYLTLPVLIELQIPADNRHLNISGGLIGAVKLGSQSKMIFDSGEKVKSNNDFSLNLLRFGATARVGFGGLQIFSTYYFTPMFKEGKGPGGHELYPVEIGLAFSFNG